MFAISVKLHLGPDVEPGEVLHDPRPPLAEGDILSGQDAPEDEAPDEDHGEDEHEWVKPDLAHKGELDPHPVAVVLFGDGKNG